jgi:hypothetical protein
MATMEDYDFENNDDNFLYVEDTYLQAVSRPSPSHDRHTNRPAQDDLAEHAVASPVPYDGEEDGYDSDHWRYDYWMDIEYDSDGEAVRARRCDAFEARRKRQRTAATAATAGSPRKRRKVASGIAYASDDSPAVLLVHGRVDETQRLPASPGHLQALRPWALLKDWRERGLGTAPPFPTRYAPTRLAQVVDIVEDEDEDEDGVGDGEGYGPDSELVGDAKEGDELSQLLGAGGLDPEVLKMVLREKLSAAGLKDLDEASLMRFAARMFAGDGEADDIAGELAEELLEQEDENDGGEITEWVSQQVQSSKRGAVEDPLSPVEEPPKLLPFASTPAGRRPPTPASTATSSSADVPLPEANTSSPRGQKRKADLSAEAPSQTKTKRSLAPSSSVSTVQGKKRKADPDDEPPQPKRPARSFDAPTAASKSRSVSTGAVTSKATRKTKK